MRRKQKFPLKMRELVPIVLFVLLVLHLLVPDTSRFHLAHAASAAAPKPPACVPKYYEEECDYDD